MTPSSLFLLFNIQLVLKVKQQVDASCYWVCHGRFHDVLPKEHPGAFYDGDYIKKCLLTIMVSQILYLAQLISEIKNIVNCCKRTFLYSS